MWGPMMTLRDSDAGRIAGVWIAPDGGELLVLTEAETTYWRAPEKRALWTVRERAGGEGLSPDGRLYRDSASGLFYPLLGPHGGRQLREHPTGGHITVDDKTGRVAVTDPAGEMQTLSQGNGLGDWRVAGFCESGARILVAEPRCLVLHAPQDRR